ncbi:hypothetical protein B0H63DRAFT_89855 [Podospora didyma]|uniref:Uncharacterized protein n=1 Tax=Podospora didyma TaxID=330526 RepID=A0AAE0N0Q0_9PEZI|nr:hypothetical protein B0H63DRAFT_89855 [Podospora didyma]
MCTACSGSTTPSTERFLTQLEKDEFLRLWGLHVSAWNPEPGRQPPPLGRELNPLKVVPGGDVSFAALLRIPNRVQRHHCLEAYCLR